MENSEILVAKFFNKLRINLEANIRTLNIMWRSGGSFDIRDPGNNTVMLLFDDENDLKCIQMQGPWSVDKYTVGLFHLGEAATVEGTRFDTTSFWVQIHGLQIRCMTRENAEAIGSTLGRVGYIEESAKGDCHGRCM